jgi:ribosome-associated translation inhibitor RaiA
MLHSLNLIADDLSRQVKRYRDKRRARRQTRAATTQQPAPATTN